MAAPLVGLIGVISGVLRVYSFVEGLFPETPTSANTFHMRIGIDGTTNPDNNGPLGGAGGEKPDVRCFNEVGTFLGLEVNNGNTCDSGQEDCSTQVKTNNACSYTLFSANPDAICIGWISVRTPGGDRFGNTIGEWAEYCDANFGTGGAWYWSNVNVELDTGSTKVKCAWIDQDGDVPTTGLQIHWTEFTGQEEKPAQHFCENNPSLRFLTEPDPSVATVWVPARHRSMRDLTALAMSPVDASPADKQRRAADKQYTRLSKRFETDTRIVKSKRSEHSATSLCAGNKSVGPSFVSYEERKFCEMRTKTVLPFCEDTEAGQCWDDANNTVSSRGDDAPGFTGEPEVPVTRFGKTILWE